MSAEANDLREIAYSTVPFSRDPHFIKRGVVLDRVRDECLTSRGSAVLLGPEGVGKTSLALEFAHTLLQENKISVFWIDASSHSRYMDGVRAIAETCQIHGRHVSDRRLTDIVQRWLQSYGPSDKVNWCIIIDGADLDGLFGLPRQDRLLHTSLTQYGGNGCILATTRNKHVAAGMSSTQAKTQIIGPMSRKDALALYQVKTNAHLDSDTWKMAGELVEQLDYSPTTITRAAINRLQYPKMSSTEFLSTENIRKIVEEAESSKPELHKGEWTDETPWDAAINQLEQENPSAVSLLYLMSFFNDYPIPALVLQLEGVPREPEAHLPCSDQPAENLWDQTDVVHYESLQFKFREDSQVLLDRFLISCNEETDTFEAHYAVQLAAKKRLTSKGEFERYSREFIARLARVLPTTDYAHFERVRELWTHFEKVLDYPQSDDAFNLQRATVLHNGSWCAMTVGFFDVALKLVDEAVAIRQSLLGEEHEATLESQNQRALLLCYTRKVQEAVTLQEATVETSTAVLGRDHHLTLQGMHHLVPIYWNINRASEAIDVMEDVVEMRKRSMGEEHDETLVCKGLLAHVYWVLQRLDSAEDLAGPLLECRLRLSGPDHPSTLSITNTLGSVYCDQERYKEAKELLEPAVERMKRVVGEDHPDTLNMVLSLALVQKHLGSDQIVLETQHSAMNTLQRLANVSYEQAMGAFNKLLKAQIDSPNPYPTLNFLFQLKAVIERSLGTDNFEVLACLQTLVQGMKNTNPPMSVVSMEELALRTARDIAGETNSITMTLMDGLANTKYELGSKEEALALMQECVDFRQKILGPEHPDTLKSMATLEEWERSKRRRTWMNKFIPFKKGP